MSPIRQLRHSRQVVDKWDSVVNRLLRTRRRRGEISASGRFLLVGWGEPSDELLPTFLTIGRSSMYRNPTRRDFLRRSTVVPFLTVLGVPAVVLPLRAAEPIQRAVGGPRLKTSLNAYSFSTALSEGIQHPGQGFTLFDLLDFAAEF